jgi:hypothetical protein
MRNGLHTNEFGTKMWYHKGKLHRTDGLAVEYTDGHRLWYQNDQLHRTTGPAVEHANGDYSWYSNGRKYDFDSWCKLTKQTPQQITLLRLQFPDAINTAVAEFAQPNNQ